jgi:ATP-dependent Lhr-like helicase
MRRLPPHILVTTPESLYLLLTSESGRRMLASTRTVIVDEIHAVAPSKRGAHLALSLERLAALCALPLQRIGLSATQKPIEDVARFLVGVAVPGASGGLRHHR